MEGMLRIKTWGVFIFFLSSLWRLLLVAEGAAEGDRAAQDGAERAAAEAVPAWAGTTGGAGTAEEGEGGGAQGTGTRQAGHWERQVGEKQDIERDR